MYTVLANPHHLAAGTSYKVRRGHAPHTAHGQITNPVTAGAPYVGRRGGAPHTVLGLTGCATSS